MASLFAEKLPFFILTEEEIGPKRVTERNYSASAMQNWRNQSAWIAKVVDRAESKSLDAEFWKFIKKALINRCKTAEDAASLWKKMTETNEPFHSDEWKLVHEIILDWENQSQEIRHGHEDDAGIPPDAIGVHGNKLDEIISVSFRDSKNLVGGKPKLVTATFKPGLPIYDSSDIKASAYGKMMLILKMIGGPASIKLREQFSKLYYKHLAWLRSEFPDLQPVTKKIKSIAYAIFGRDSYGDIDEEPGMMAIVNATKDKTTGWGDQDIRDIVMDPRIGEHPDAAEPAFLSPEGHQNAREQYKQHIVDVVSKFDDFSVKLRSSDRSLSQASGVVDKVVDLFAELGRSTYDWHNYGPADSGALSSSNPVFSDVAKYIMGQWAWALSMVRGHLWDAPSKKLWISGKPVEVTRDIATAEIKRWIIDPPQWPESTKTDGIITRLTKNLGALSGPAGKLSSRIKLVQNLLDPENSAEIKDDIMRIAIYNAEQFEVECEDNYNIPGVKKNKKGEAIEDENGNVMKYPSFAEIYSRDREKYKDLTPHQALARYIDEEIAKRAKQ